MCSLASSLWKTTQECMGEPMLSMSQAKCIRGSEAMERSMLADLAIFVRPGLGPVCTAHAASVSTFAQFHGWRGVLTSPLVWAWWWTVSAVNDQAQLFTALGFHTIPRAHAVWQFTEPLRPTRGGGLHFWFSGALPRADHNQHLEVINHAFPNAGERVDDNHAHGAPLEDATGGVPPRPLAAL